MWCGTDISAAALKDSAQNKRGKVSVRLDTRISGDWTAFWRVDKNKQELFLCMAEQLTTIGTGNGEEVSTKHKTVFFNNDRTDTADLSPCTHEEADTRLLLHTVDAARRGTLK